MSGRQFTRRLFTGIATYVPGVVSVIERTTGGTDAPAYCYHVWLRHLILAHEAGLPTDPRSVIELGPGDSIGTGIAALLTGATTYASFDLVSFADNARNLEMIEPLRRLLAVRAPLPPLPSRPHDPQIPFPHDVLDDERLTNALAPARLHAIRAAVADPGREHDGICVLYTTGPQSVPNESNAAEMLFSQAVLEHVDDLASIHVAIADSLRAGGFVSHAIDFRSHLFARDWNGHWTFSDRTWSLVRGRRRFAINREPLSSHLRLIEASGLEIVAVHRTIQRSQISRQELASRFRGMSSEDLETASAVVQAIKR